MESGIKVNWPGWQVVRRIGQGSFGAVYEIERDVFGKTEKAALKVMSIPESRDEIDDLQSRGYTDASITEHFRGYLEDIVKEYSIMLDLKGHTNVVYSDELKYVQHDDGIGWDIYIKMELLKPLHKVQSQDYNEAETIRLGMDICNALILCKQSNIIHRDIKPQNILVSKTGDYKLGDFGVAKVSDKTMSGTKIGTYEYMAPEVYRGGQYGAGADIYSLGLVLYWMMNRKSSPFCPLPPKIPTTTQKETGRTRRLGGEPLPPPVDGSDALKKIVLKACAYDPNDRFSSAKQMRDALAALQSGAADFVSDREENEDANSTVLDRDYDDTERLKTERIKTERIKTGHGAGEQRTDNQVIERKMPGDDSQKQQTATKLLIGAVCVGIAVVILLLILLLRGGSDADPVAETTLPAVTEQETEETKEETQKQSEEALVGWQSINGAVFFYDGSGTPLKGVQQLDGAVYYFDDTGVMQTGWQEVLGVRHYFGADGRAVQGWYTVDGYTYYFTSDGSVATHWQFIDGAVYCFGADGKRMTGWQLDPAGNTFYLNPDNGAAVTGWQDIGNARYYFKEDGIRSQNEMVQLDGNGYQFDGNGCLTHITYGSLGTYLSRNKLNVDIRGGKRVATAVWGFNELLEDCVSFDLTVTVGENTQSEWAVYTQVGKDWSKNQIFNINGTSITTTVVLDGPTDLVAYAVVCRNADKQNLSYSVSVTNIKTEYHFGQ